MPAGGFAVDPEAARAALDRCTKQIQLIDEQIARLRAIEGADYGRCGVGQGLTLKFRDKLDGGSGLIGKLTEARHALVAMAAAFHQSAVAYARVEAMNQRSYGSAT